MIIPNALVCGHATLDRIGGALVPGGSVYFAARALAALGAGVRVLTAAGEDFPRDALRATPETPTPAVAATATPAAAGTIDALILLSNATTIFENVYAADGRRSQRVLSTAPPLDAARLPAAWRQADLLFLAPVLAEVDPAAFVTAVRARVVGLGVQGLVREVGADGVVSPRRWEPDRAALRGVTAAVLGDDEAAGQPDLAGRLAAAVPIVVFTHGARGCEVIVRGRTWRVGIHAAREVDPTGAGDVFAAAFLLALASGEDPTDAARLGAAAASIVVEGRGGESLPRIGEAWARAARVPVGPET